MNGSKSNEASINRARNWINDAESILFTSGAGLTAAAGINYADTKLFAREFPAMLQYGFSAQYQFIGFNDWTPDLQWGYWAAHVDLVRFRWPQSDVYQSLHKLAKRIGEENTFVMTSNVDGMFEKNGFNPQRIYTPQGDYSLLQCTTPCTREVWPWKDQIDLIRVNTDPETQRLTDLSLIPKCPNCGETVFPNVRVDRSFIHDHFDEDAENLNHWIMEAQQRRGVVIEIGSGFNTPTVIRKPGEQLAYTYPSWNLIRINLTDSFVPPQLGDQAIGLKGDATKIISSLISLN